MECSSFSSNLKGVSKYAQIINHRVKQIGKRNVFEIKEATFTKHRHLRIEIEAYLVVIKKGLHKYTKITSITN